MFLTQRLALFFRCYGLGFLTCEFSETRTNVRATRSDEAAYPRPPQENSPKNGFVLYIM